MHISLKAICTMLCLAAFAVWAQQKVDQGKPGNQGAWPVTFSSPTFPTDGGVPSGGAPVAIYPYRCASTSPVNKYACDGGVQTIGSASSRLYTVVTNSGDDLGAGSGFVKCRPDGTNPTLTAGSAGNGLTAGNSINYTNVSGAPIKCICSTGYIGSFECVP
jgi:hypothetical protein